MIPISDYLPTRRLPVVTYLLIAANVAIFILQILSGGDEQAMLAQFALIPADFVTNFGLKPVANIFTSMFMHAGLAHLGGNMLYLWIFGDNVEDRMGHGRYLLFYLLGGVGAALAHILIRPDSTLPTVGASGAIAAVLGAYMIYYPHSRVLTLIPLGFFVRVTVVPAGVVLGLWFVFQLFSGVLVLGAPQMGGIAFWAHIGGFVVGMLLANLFSNPDREPPQWRSW